MGLSKKGFAGKLGFSLYCDSKVAMVIERSSSVDSQCAMVDEALVVEAVRYQSIPLSSLVPLGVQDFSSSSLSC